MLARVHACYAARREDDVQRSRATLWLDLSFWRYCFPNYTSGILTSITVLGRTLTLTYTSGRITAVTDGTRTIHYGYDANHNLTSFTDANSKIYTYQYDQPGRMTKYFKPQNPTVAFMTNVYDSQSRVKTQSDARAI